jgi:hypothetical protein
MNFVFNGFLYSPIYLCPSYLTLIMCGMYGTIPMSIMWTSLHCTYMHICGKNPQLEA